METFQIRKTEEGDLHLMHNDDIALSTGGIHHETALVMEFLATDLYEAQKTFQAFRGENHRIGRVSVYQLWFGVLGDTTEPMLVDQSESFPYLLGVGWHEAVRSLEQTLDEIHHWNMSWGDHYQEFAQDLSPTPTDDGVLAIWQPKENSWGRYTIRTGYIKSTDVTKRP